MKYREISIGSVKFNISQPMMRERQRRWQWRQQWCILCQSTKRFVSGAGLKRDPYCGSELIILGAPLKYLKYLISHTLRQLTRRERRFVSTNIVFLCIICGRYLMDPDFRQCSRGMTGFPPSWCSVHWYQNQEIFCHSTSPAAWLPYESVTPSDFTVHSVGVALDRSKSLFSESHCYFPCTYICSLAKCVGVRGSKTWVSRKQMHSFSLRIDEVLLRRVKFAVRSLETEHIWLIHLFVATRET